MQRMVQQAHREQTSGTRGMRGSVGGVGGWGMRGGLCEGSGGVRLGQGAESSRLSFGSEQQHLLIDGL